MELEELAQEYKHMHMGNDNDDIEIVRGGCRNFCSMGPNVHFNQPQQHFTKVKDIQECGSVFLEATLDTSDCDETTKPPTTVSMATKMLLRRAEQQRWQCLRQMARLKASRKVLSQDHVERVKTQLEACLELERRAVLKNSNAELQSRDARRGERLRVSLECIVQENGTLSDDSSDSSEDETTDATNRVAQTTGQEM